jgi:hypothetical protein
MESNRRSVTRPGRDAIAVTDAHVRVGVMATMASQSDRYAGRLTRPTPRTSTPTASSAAPTSAR